MDREAWHVAAHGVAKSGTQLSDWTDWLNRWSFLGTEQKLGGGGDERGKTSSWDSRSSTDPWAELKIEGRRRRGQICITIMGRGAGRGTLRSWIKVVPETNPKCTIEANPIHFWKNQSSSLLPGHGKTTSWKKPCFFKNYEQHTVNNMHIRRPHCWGQLSK